MAVSPEADLLRTLPCVGKILSMILLLEIGSVERFPAAAHLAGYAGWCRAYMRVVVTRVWDRFAGM